VTNDRRHTDHSMETCGQIGGTLPLQEINKPTAYKSQTSTKCSASRHRFFWHFYQMFVFENKT